MAKQEVKTDAFVRKLLENAKINFFEQGSSAPLEIENALQKASKNKTGKLGCPDFVAQVKDFLLVIEDKADLDKHCKFAQNKSDDIVGVWYALSLDKSTSAIKEYAVNGAIWYAEHLIENTHFKKIFAFGVSGDEKHHKITPIFIGENKIEQLENIDNFIDFNASNIEDFYQTAVEKIDNRTEKTEDLIKKAKQLHEDLRNYGNLTNEDKPVVVAGILLALQGIKRKTFNIESLSIIYDENSNNQKSKPDGELIFDAIKETLEYSTVDDGKETLTQKKRDIITDRISFIKTSTDLNQIHPKLGKSPLKYYTEFLYDLFGGSRYFPQAFTNSAEDYLGRFYGEFMSFAGGDGQELGIVLTPKHITELFCDLLELTPDDKVIDPCCGTGGFLVAAMHKMLSQTNDPEKQKNIRKNQLYGIENQRNIFVIAVANMILHGDGKANLEFENFLTVTRSPKNPDKPSKEELDNIKKYKELNKKLRFCTKAMMNPPYSQDKKKGDIEQSEISFIERLLDSIGHGAKCAVIVPQSTMTGGNRNAQKQIKERIYNKHTLEGVITLNPETFYGVGVMPCIAIFTAHQKHPENKICKFINFEDDGFKVAPNVGLIETPQAKSKKQHLLDVWFDKAEEQTKFCVKTTIEATDEWLHSFYYFNDEIPTEEDFDKTIGDYLTFEFSMIMQGREYLFADNQSFRQPETGVGSSQNNPGDENE